MHQFYKDPAVCQRLVEYLGGDCLDQASAVYVTHTDGCSFRRGELRPPGDLQWFLDRHLDIARSLADRRSLLLHLDMEYVNFDAPGTAYLDPMRTFELQEPVVRVVETLLLGWGITPLHLITGQGHHFVWRVGVESEVAAKIAALRPDPELVDRCCRRVGDGVAGEIDRHQQESFAGMALLMEYLAARIKWEAAPQCALPVEVTAVHVGSSGGHGREMISLDISEYGDPLHTRMVRMPYTQYLKPWITGLAREVGMEDHLQGFATLPLHEMDVAQALACRINDGSIIDLARRASGRIPRMDRGTARMLEEYLGSPLRKFHHDFYQVDQATAASLRKVPLAHVAPCVRLLLEQPNDRLLKPAGMQLVTRALLAEHWHPRDIAGLIRSRFEDPTFQWGVDWEEYDPASRADFYTRLFAGLWVTGVDELVDFNCISNQEKGFCSHDRTEHCSLQTYQETLTHLHHS